MLQRSAQIRGSHHDRVARALVAPRQKGESEKAYSARIDLAAAHHRARVSFRTLSGAKAASYQPRRVAAGMPENIHLDPTLEQQAMMFAPVGNVMNKATLDLVTAAKNFPGGIRYAGGQVAHDVSKGHLSLPRTRHMGRQMIHQTKQDFRHPLRDPGYLGLDILGLASLGTGTAARGVAAVSKLGEGGSVAARFAAAGRAAKDVSKVQPRIYTRPGAVRYEPLDMPHHISDLASGAHQEMVMGKSGKLVPRQVEDHLGYSPSAMVRGVQKLRDRRLMRDSNGLERKLRKIELQNNTLTRDIGLGRGAIKPVQIEDTRGIAGQSIDAVNQLGVLGKVMARPAYAATNFPGNLDQLAIQHNMNPIAFARSVRLAMGVRSELRAMRKSGDARAAAHAATARNTLKHVVGQGGERSLALEGFKETGGAVSRNVKRALNVPAHGNRVLGNFYQKTIDLGPREVAFAHEAQKLGFTKPADVIKLLTHDDHLTDLQRSALRTRRAMVDFSAPDLSGRGFDKMARRAVFVYPWVKGSSIFARDFALRHPLQAGATGQYGRLGDNVAQQQLGSRPSYAQGIFKSGSKLVPGVGKLPLVRNLNSVSPFGTPLDMLMAGTQLVNGVAPGQDTGDTPARDFLNPLLDSAGAAIFGVKKQGIPTNGAGFPKLLMENLTQIPALNAANALLHKGQYAPGYDKSKLLYPDSPVGVVKTFSLGGWHARPYNPKVGRAKYRSEVSATLHGADRVKKQYEWHRSDLLDILKQTGLASKGAAKLPPQIEGPLAFKEALAVEGAKLRAAKGKQATAADRIGVYLNALADEGRMSRKTATDMSAAYARVYDSMNVPKTLKDAKFDGMKGQLIRRFKAQGVDPAGDTLTRLARVLSAQGFDLSGILQ